MEDYTPDVADENTPSVDAETTAGEELDRVEKEAEYNHEDKEDMGDSRISPPTGSMVANADNYLVTMATTTACLGVACEVIDNLAGNGLTLAMADGKIPESSDIRRLVSKALHTSINDRTITFNNAANIGE